MKDNKKIKKPIVNAAARQIQNDIISLLTSDEKWIYLKNFNTEKAKPLKGVFCVR